VIPPSNILLPASYLAERVQRRDAAAELRRVGVRPSRRLGQHFLVDDRVARRQVDMAKIRGEETILEVGPGLGILTRLLAAQAKRVIAIEKDSRLASFLEGLGGRVEIVRGDALKISWPKFDAMVSNLPYQISSPVLFKLLDHQFDRAVLMVQREFAERLVAPPRTKDYSRLTVNVAHRAECEILETVPRSAFFPQPRVDSAIVRLARREPAYKVLDELVFRETVDACFLHRRKTIRNALDLEWLRFAKDHGRWRDSIGRLPFLDERAEVLSPQDFAALSNEIGVAKG